MLRILESQATLPSRHRSSVTLPQLVSQTVARIIGPRLGQAAGLLMLTAVLLLASCGDSSNSVPQVSQTELFVYNWEDYFAPDTLTRFEAETGIRVVLDTFDNEDEMLAGLQTRPGHYDVVIVADSLMSELNRLRLLEPLSLQKIPNISNIEGRFLDLPFDPGNQYSVPYLWGTTALAVNTSRIPENYDSWEVLWDPANSDRIALLNDPQEAIGVALQVLGYSFNSRESEHLAEAMAKLREQKPLLAGYLDTITIMEKLISGDLWAAQVYNGEGARAAAENPDVVFLIPREGGAIWIDNMAVPLGAPHKAGAHQFINFIHKPEIAAAITNYVYYAYTPIQTVRRRN